MCCFCGIIHKANHRKSFAICFSWIGTACQVSQGIHVHLTLRHVLLSFLYVGVSLFWPKGAFWQINMPHLQQQRGVANQVNHDRTLKQKSITQFSSSHSLPKVNCFDRKQMARHETAVCLKMWQQQPVLPAFCFWYFTVWLYYTVAKEIEQVSNNNIKPQDCAIHIFFGRVQKLETRESNENNERIRIWSDMKQLVSTLFWILSWLALNSSFDLSQSGFKVDIWIKYGNFVRRLAGL